MPIDPYDSALDCVKSITVKMDFACGTVYAIIDSLADCPVRVFMKKGHTGLCTQALLEAVGRLITLIICETDLGMDRVWHTLVGISCESGSPFESGNSCMDGLAKKLREFYPDKFTERSGDG